MAKTRFFFEIWDLDLHDLIEHWKVFAHKVYVCQIKLLEWVGTPYFGCYLKIINTFFFFFFFFFEMINAF